MYDVITQTDAYDKSIDYINENLDLKSELGEVTETVLISGGGISVQNSFKGGEDSALISFIVKGEKRYKEITAHLYKTLDDEDWVVYEVEK